MRDVDVGELMLYGATSTDFMSQGCCFDSVAGVRDFLSNLDLTKTKEYDDFFVVNNSVAKEMPGNLGKLAKPAIVLRGSSGYDVGFVDIFQAHKLFPDYVPEGLLTNMMRDTMSRMGFDNIACEFSLYYNKGIKKIRGWHRDVPLEGKKKLFKFFIYLSDVEDIAYGPYSYMLGTHNRARSEQIAGHLIGKYNDPNEYDCDLDIRTFLGRAGTLIVSNQGGMHRGMPQQDGKSRLVIVCKARPL